MSSVAICACTVAYSARFRLRSRRASPSGFGSFPVGYLLWCQEGIDASTKAGLVKHVHGLIACRVGKSEVTAYSVACAVCLVVEVHGRTPDRFTAARARRTGLENRQESLSQALVFVGIGLMETSVGREFRVS